MGSEIALASFPRLTNAEKSLLVDCEYYIAGRMTAVAEIGDKLAIIRDKKLYREEYRTFREYLADKWHLSPQTAYFQIAHVETVKTIAMSPRGDILPSVLGQTKPLNRLSGEQKVKAWSEAVRDADGDQPTLSQVQAAANRVSPPIKRSSERPARPTDDSDASIAAARASGIIPSGADIEIDDPGREYYGAEPDPEPEPTPEPIAPAVDSSDEGWLKGLPLTREFEALVKRNAESKPLANAYRRCLARFHATALAFRRTRDKLNEYRGFFLAETKALRGGLNGAPLAFDWMHKRIFTLNPPDRWESCGTCQGVGSGPSGGCPTCHGNGFICN